MTPNSLLPQVFRSPASLAAAMTARKSAPVIEPTPAKRPFVVRGFRLAETCPFADPPPPVAVPPALPLPAVAMVEPVEAGTKDCLEPASLRNYVLGGAARVELHWPEHNERVEFAISRHPSKYEPGQHVYFVNALLPGHREYVGMWKVGNLAMKPGQATDIADLAGRFADWWRGIVNGQSLEGVTASTLESRSAARAAERAERKATQKRAKLAADLRDAAAQEGGAPPSAAAVAAIQEGLRELARLDADHAKYRNKVGFSALDSRFGHHLAALETLSTAEAIVGRVLMRRYAGQLRADLVTKATDGMDAPPPKQRRYTERDLPAVEPTNMWAEDEMVDGRPWYEWCD